jgi:hypothetical protein
MIVIGLVEEPINTKNDSSQKSQRALIGGVHAPITDMDTKELTSLIERI